MRGRTVSIGLRTVPAIFAAVLLIMSLAAAGQESVLWNFGSGSDGEGPSGSLVADADGTLYGTTTLGGQYGQGELFRLVQRDSGWQEIIMHEFGSGQDDGIHPNGSLILVNGTLWGTTNGGGKYGYGTIFSISPGPGGVYTIYTIYWNFEGNDMGRHDGASPLTGLIADADGNLYGTTYKGGQFNYGTVFRLSQGQRGGWVYQHLWSFQNGSDGAYPEGGLILSPNGDGNLYGTTSEGGTNQQGTAFKLTYEPYQPAPKLWDGYVESVLYSFGDGTDATQPSTALILPSDGRLWGTTERGGMYHAGTIYAVGQGGDYVGYSFGVRGDGINPLGSPIFGYGEYNPYLFGTTSGGGQYGKGTVYSWQIYSDEDTILWSFGNGNDGVSPSGSLIEGPGGYLYGTTAFGGLYNGGTVFSVVPYTGEF